MQQIADWLKTLGMSEYAERFAENRIDFSVLRDLTDQDLKDLGVVLGDRRKMLRAIGELGSARAPPTAPAPPPVTPAPLAAAPPRPSVPVEAAAERRHVTVMFCDLVGSTSISAGLDAEDWRDLVGAYLDAASAAVTEMGGHVAKKLGDGVMALFVWPSGRSRKRPRTRSSGGTVDPKRGARRGELRSGGSGKPTLSGSGIGIETGPVVIDAAGVIYGDAPNVAARVQALAGPGTVLVTAGVQRQVAGLFVVEERGAHTLKGVPEPTALFRLVRASGGGHRSGQRNLTPLVGRDEETAMLMRRWDRARQGDGQLVLIVGEPGLGKSRLIEEFHSRLSDTPHTWVEWSCSQLLQNTPLHPIAEWGHQRFGGADMPAAQRLAELESSLAQVKLDPVENVPLLAPLLDVPLPRERAPALAPEELWRRQLAALINWVIAGAKSQPLVLAFEDLHWADPTTLDVLRGIAEPRRARAVIGRGDDPARVPSALGACARITARSRSPARSRPGAGDGGGAFSPPCAAAERRGRCRLPHRRRAAVRRGGDAAPFGARRRGRRHRGDAGDAATVAHGPARPARPRQGGGAGRLGDRSRFLLQAVTGRRRNGQRAAGSGPGKAFRCRHRAGRRRAAEKRGLLPSMHSFQDAACENLLKRAGARSCIAA